MSSAHVYVIDDDPTIRQMMHEILNLAGYRGTTDVLDDGTLERLWAAQPTVIMIEVREAYPERGWQLASEVHRDPTTRDIPLILISTDRAFPTTLTNEVGMHNLSLLRKPFVVPELLALLAGLHRHRCQAGETS